jgi:hypothetical protein
MVNQNKEVLSSKQLSVIRDLSVFRGEYYLAGGTAIALQLMHRKSIDFDLFTARDIEQGKVLQRLNRDKIQSILVDKSTELTLLYDGIKLTFLKYDFPFTPEVDVSFLTCLSLIDLAATKAYTLGRRSKWKDYVDLYFLIKKFSLTEVVMRSQEKYLNLFSEKLFREQLAYFDDVDYSEKIQYLTDPSPSDGEIKSYLKKVAVS